MTELFRSLDFETKSDVGDSYSLTLQRGDGVQVRHIPQILSFLSDKSSIEYHIWGFEEPENSLELASAIEEAQTFREFGSDANKQVFLTSHSPAFFSLTDEDVERFFVSKSEVNLNRLNSRVTAIGHDLANNPGELMGETPHLPVISSYLLEAHEKIRRQQAASDELRQEVLQRTKPVVFVEGVTDKAVFEKAWQILIGGDMPFNFVSGGGTAKMESLGQDGSVFSQLAPGRNVFCLLDNDKEGREMFRPANGPGGNWTKHKGNGVYWCRLPLNGELSQLMKSLKIDEKFWPGCLENFFSAEIRERAVNAGAYATEETPHPALFGEMKKIIQYTKEREDLLHYHVLAPTAEAKERFADWIVDNADGDPQIFEPLRSTLEGLRDLILEE